MKKNEKKIKVKLTNKMNITTNHYLSTPYILTTVILCIIVFRTNFKTDYQNQIKVGLSIKLDILKLGLRFNFIYNYHFFSNRHCNLENKYTFFQYKYR